MTAKGVLSLVRVARVVGLVASAPDICSGCGWGIRDAGPSTVHGHISFSYLGPIPLCPSCRYDCYEVCDTAVSLIQFQGPMALVGGRPAPIVALRIALVRALPEIIMRVVPRLAPDWSEQCAWCDNYHVSQGTMIVRCVHGGCGRLILAPAVAHWARRAFVLHVSCRDTMMATVRATWIDRCASGLVFMLGDSTRESVDRLHDARHVIIYFLLRLTADGVEAAAAVSPRVLG